MIKVSKIVLIVVVLVGIDLYADTHSEVGNCVLEFYKNKHRCERLMRAQERNKLFPEVVKKRDLDMFLANPLDLSKISVHDDEMKKKAREDLDKEMKAALAKLRLEFIKCLEGVDDPEVQKTVVKMKAEKNN